MLSWPGGGIQHPAAWQFHSIKIRRVANLEIPLSGGGGSSSVFQHAAVVNCLYATPRA